MLYRYKSTNSDTPEELRARRDADDLADIDILELTASLRIAAQHKASNSLPPSPAPSAASSAGAPTPSALGAASGLQLKKPAKPAAPQGAATAASGIIGLPLSHASVAFDPLRPPHAKASASAWSEPPPAAGAGGSREKPVGNDSASNSGVVARMSSPAPGDMSDSSRASSVSKALLLPLPVSRRRRKAEASREAQASSQASIERRAAQSAAISLQGAWRSHLARLRVERRRKLAKRRAAKATPGTHRRDSGRAELRHTNETERREETAARYDGRQGGGESRGSGGAGRPRQQSGAAQMRVVEDEKRRQGQGGGGSDESELRSVGVGRATPLHSTGVGVGEESLEGLLQDLGL